jgi:hypothetical protein
MNHITVNLSKPGEPLATVTAEFHDVRYIDGNPYHYTRTESLKVWHSLFDDFSDITHIIEQAKLDFKRRKAFKVEEVNQITVMHVTI